MTVASNDNSKKAASSQAFVTFFKSLFGAGLLTLPNVFGKVGLVLGGVTYVLVGVGCTMTCYLLLQARDMAKIYIGTKRNRIHNCSTTPHLVTYGDLASILLNPFMATVTRWTIIILHILFTAGLIIVICENMSSFFGNFGESVSQAMVGITLLPFVIIMLQLPWLQDMYFVSFIGLLVYSFGVLGSTLYSSVLYISRKEEYDYQQEILLVDWSGLPSFIGSAVYALEGINLALPTVHSMEHQKDAVPVVCFSVLLYAAITLIFAVVGNVGGLGNPTCDVVTQCIHPDWLKSLLEIALSIAMLLSLPIMLYPSTEMLEVMLADWKQGGPNVEDRVSSIDCESEKTHLIYSHPETTESEEDILGNTMDPLIPMNLNPNTTVVSYSQEKSTALRICLATLTVTMGAFTPSFTHFSSFVGAVGLTFAGFVLPPILYIEAMNKTRQVIRWEIKVGIFFLLAFGIFNMIIGGYSSGLDLINSLKV